MIWMKRVQLTQAVILLAVLLISGAGIATENGQVKPSRKDKCPVCGMLVYKYPDWTAKIIFQDGSVEFFDGAKDLFKYYLNPVLYRPGKSKKDIVALYVMEYYDMKMIDARKAFFVTGSDIYGPMGHELIALAKVEDAQKLLGDHRGKKMFQFAGVTSLVIENLE